MLIRGFGTSPNPRSLCLIQGSLLRFCGIGRQGWNFDSFLSPPQPDDRPSTESRAGAAGFVTAIQDSARTTAVSAKTAAATIPGLASRAGRSLLVENPSIQTVIPVFSPYPCSRTAKKSRLECVFVVSGGYSVRSVFSKPAGGPKDHAHHLQPPFATFAPAAAPVLP